MAVSWIVLVEKRAATVEKPAFMRTEAALPTLLPAQPQLMVGIRYTIMLAM